MSELRVVPAGTETQPPCFKVVDGDTGAEVGQVDHVTPQGWAASAPDGWSSSDHPTPVAAVRALREHLSG